MCSLFYNYHLGFTCCEPGCVHHTYVLCFEGFLASTPAHMAFRKPEPQEDIHCLIPAKTHLAPQDRKMWYTVRRKIHQN